MVKKTTAENPSKIAIDFDLITKQCKSVFGGSASKAYRVLEKDLISHGFIHDEWSGYVSNDPLTKLEVMSVVKGFVERNPWLFKCINKFRVTKASEDYFNGESHGDLMRTLGEMIDSDNATSKIVKNTTSKKPIDNAPKPPSFAEIAEQYKDYRPPQKSRADGKDNGKKPSNRGNSGR